MFEMILLISLKWFTAVKSVSSVTGKMKRDITTSVYIIEMKLLFSF